MGGQHSNESVAAPVAGRSHSSTVARSSKDYDSGNVADDTPKIGFEDFQVLRAIGKGSFGKVCIVQKKDTKRMYAMKYMNKVICVQRDAFRNVLREIEILAHLNHPFLVNLWFSFQDEEDMFMVFDLLLGGDLRYHLNAEGRFDQERVKLYVCEIGLGLDYLRKMRVIHRDIKPDNIVLDSDGHAHITDFNIATQLSENSLATSLTGTRPYIAPEIFRVNAHDLAGYSYAVDWWSLGVCVYEMLAGRRPFDIQANMTAKDALGVFARTPLVVSHDWQPSLIALLNDLLEFNPDKRIADISRLTEHPCFVGAVKFEDVLRRRIRPVYVPPKDCLNCDPTFELEEMIIESKPLHKKKKRLAKTLSQNLGGGGDDSPPGSPLRDALANIRRQFTVYNREMLLKDEEERLRRLEAELGIRPDIQDDAIAKRLGRLD